MIPKSIKLNKENEELLKYLKGILKECETMKPYAGLPGKVVELSNKLSGYYAYLVPFRIRFKALEAEFYSQNWKDGDKKLSDKKLECLWLMTENGVMQYATKNVMRALEKAIKSVSNMTYTLNQEYRND